MSERRILEMMRCPLCPHSQQLYSLEKHDHIALHLHSFALEALPGDINQDLNPLDDHNSDPSRRSQDDLDTEWRLQQFIDDAKVTEVHYSPT